MVELFLPNYKDIIDNARNNVRDEEKVEKKRQPTLDFVQVARLRADKIIINRTGTVRRAGFDFYYYLASVWA